MRSFSAMDAYKDSEPSRFALATRRAERSALSSSAGDELGCAKAAVPAAQARKKSAGRDSMDAKALGGLLDPALQVFLDELGGEHDLGVVLGGVLELLQIVQPAVLVDPVDRRDQPHGLLPARVEMLMDGVRRNVDHVPRLPLPALHLVLRLPVVGVGDLHVAVLVQVVAPTFHHVKTLLGQMPVPARAAPRRNDL